jgi:hypothetical protein
MDKFVSVKTTSGNSFINLAEVSVICFSQHEDSCDIHLKSGTIFTTLSTIHGNKFFELHENYLKMVNKARTYEVRV